MIVAIIIALIASIGIDWQLLSQVMIYQWTEVTSIIRFPGTGFQAGDQSGFRIHADLSYVPEKIISLFFFLTVLHLVFALMLGTPAGIWIMRFFTTLLPCPVFCGIHVGNTVDTIHYLDRTELNATFHFCLDYLFK
jgi:polyferredoxin